MTTTNKKLLTTIIREDEWARGGKNGMDDDGLGGTSLVNYGLPDSRPVRCTRCCLGFDAEQRGLTREEIGNNGVPSECLDTDTDMPTLRREVKKFAKDWSRRTARKGLDDLVEKFGGSSLEGLAVSINDAYEIDDKTKLKYLRRVFKAAGRRIVFKRQRPRVNDL